MNFLLKKHLRELFKRGFDVEDATILVTLKSKTNFLFLIYQHHHQMFMKCLSKCLSKLPKILIIRLKPSVGYNSLVLYDFKLDMAEFFKGENCMNEVTQYNLIGVVNHYGTNSGGHCK
jgi:hypothetical protein